MGVFGRPRIIDRIVLGVGVCVILVLVAIGLWAFDSVKEEIVEEYDSQMVTSSTVLWSLMRDTSATTPLILDDKQLPLPQADEKALRHYSKWRSYRVWRAGKLIRASANVPNASQGPNGAGFENLVTANDRWRVYTLVIPQDQMVIEVSEKLIAREKIVSHILRDLIWPLVFALPLIILVVFLATRWGLQGLSEFAARIGSRSVNDLSALDSDKVPGELVPVVVALNDLFTRLTRSYEQERIFTDSAAHELRTPLAALSIQAEVLMRASTKAERKELLDELRAGVARASRMLEQLLTIARLNSALISEERLNVFQLVQVILADIAPIALQRNVSLNLTGDEAASLLSSRELTAVLVRNLIDNAIKYAPLNSEIIVEVTAYGLSVNDQGPGIPASERALVFNRFYRRKGEATPGSGLGLAIVAELAKRLNLQISLHDGKDGRGLCARVSWQRDQ
ncbi:MAG: hypothetical protein CFE32_06265 [Alphaproteobacteria bacterium PA3]|nr:MAG: hypothetical protein CFE32_06265 [Alphaproteobacteria bacterium PA3]